MSAPPTKLAKIILEYNKSPYTFDGYLVQEIKNKYRNGVNVLGDQMDYTNYGVLVSTDLSEINEYIDGTKVKKVEIHRYTNVVYHVMIDELRVYKITLNIIDYLNNKFTAHHEVRVDDYLIKKQLIKKYKRNGDKLVIVGELKE